MQRKDSYKGVPISMAWRVFRLRMEERHPIQRVAANILNKQSRTADMGWSSFIVKKLPCYETFTIVSDLGQVAALVNVVMNIQFP
jgi:hypothetical protein